jgi:dipeptidyl aminopeptidase/acylaminoacyl peptidase
MDIYRPKQNANGAAIVLVVSGGWYSGPNLLNGAVVDFFLPEPLKRGYTVFAVYHGSQPKFTVPEAVADIKLAVRAIRTKAKDYEIDPERIGITGGSAGGHLSLMLGTTGAKDDGDPKAKDPAERTSCRVQAVACLFPPTDFLNYGGKGKNAFAAGGILTDFRTAVDFREFDAKTKRLERVGEDKHVDMLRQNSPVTHVTAAVAPTLIVHGDADTLVPIQQAELFVDRLKEVGVAAELVTKKGAGHTFAGMGPEYVKAVDWFDKHLKKK